jgi:hypothetical protein
VDFSMAKGDEIFFHIVSAKASRLNVMDLMGTSASLAASYRAGALGGKALDRNLGPNEAWFFRLVLRARIKAWLRYWRSLAWWQDCRC